MDSRPTRGPQCSYTNWWLFEEDCMDSKHLIVNDAAAPNMQGTGTDRFMACTSELQSGI